MPVYARPRVVVSRCLGFAPCRWNGETISDELVPRLGRFVEYLPVCPELEMGLGAPRRPVRLVEQKGQVRLLQPDTGRDCTQQMQEFTHRHLAGLRDIDGFLFKGRSPSCGPTDVKIFEGPEKGARARKGRGLFAAAALMAFPQAAVEHEGRVRSFSIREHFLTKLFTMAAFAQVRAHGRMGPLVEFHSAHKLLLMGYHQTGMRVLGRLVANPEHLPMGQVLAAYGQGLGQALARSPRRPAQINVLMHGMGYFKKQLNAKEKTYFQEMLEDYRAGKAPLSLLQALLRAWIARFYQGYLAGQSFFAPYPPELVDISDSGKGRDY